MKNKTKKIIRLQAMYVRHLASDIRGINKDALYPRHVRREIMEYNGENYLPVDAANRIKALSDTKLATLYRYLVRALLAFFHVDFVRIDGNAFKIKEFFIEKTVGELNPKIGIKARFARLAALTEKQQKNRLK